jgi:hypothetical protein
MVFMRTFGTKKLCETGRCPPITNPTLTQKPGISSKMKTAEQLRNSSSYKGGTKYYIRLPVNEYGAYPGAPSGFGMPLRNTF